MIYVILAQTGCCNDGDHSVQSFMQNDGTIDLEVVEYCEQVLQGFHTKDDAMKHAISAGLSAFDFEVLEVRL